MVILTSGVIGGKEEDRKYGGEYDENPSDDAFGKIRNPEFTDFHKIVA